MEKYIIIKQFGVLRTAYCEALSTQNDERRTNYFTRPLSLVGEKRMLGRVAGAFINS